MKEIHLNKGFVAVIDDEDYEIISKYHWNVWSSFKNKTQYAIAHTYKDGVRTTVKMHKLICYSDIVDHEDGNGLNNRRSNLRKASKSQNQGNRAKHKVGKSRYKGVVLQGKKWRARIGVNGCDNLGLFDSEIDAAHAYDDAAIEKFGEFARLNFERCPEVPNSKANASS